MNKKNQLLIKWIVGTAIVLTTVGYGTYKTSEYMAMPTASRVSLQNNFLQFLAYWIGIRNPDISFQENNLSDQNNPDFGQTKNAGGGNQQNPKTAANTSASQKNNPGNNPQETAESNTKSNNKNNLENRSEISAENNPESTAEYNAESNIENNSEISTENNPGSNAEYNAESNIENNSEISTENNPGSNAEYNAESGIENNSEISTENNPGSNAEYNAEGNTGNNPGNNPGNNSGTGNIDQTNLPTINPIPTDTEVSQTIASQNKQRYTLSALLAAHQALAAKVMQQAEATKYQTVTTQNIPAVSTNQPPADVVAKIKSTEIVHH